MDEVSCPGIAVGCKKYKCVKVVNAKPCELTEDIKERFHITEYEIGAAGYTVYYEDGYCSWSPKLVFEQGYNVISEKWTDRVYDEYKEILSRYDVLNDLLSDIKFREKKAPEALELLEMQRDIMRLYAVVLKKRLQRVNRFPETSGDVKNK